MGFSGWLKGDLVDQDGPGKCLQIKSKRPESPKCPCRCLQCLGEWAALNQDIQLEVTPEGQEEESFDHSWLFNKTDLVDVPALIR